MPKENANPGAILEAIQKIEIVSELIEEKNKNNLKMIAEGKMSGGKQIGPYARLLTYAPGEVIMTQGEWGGNTFYLSVDGEFRGSCTKENKGRFKRKSRDCKYCPLTAPAAFFLLSEKCYCNISGAAVRLTAEFPNVLLFKKRAPPRASIRNFHWR
jgi:hypothetical protein